MRRHTGASADAGGGGDTTAAAGVGGHAFSKAVLLGDAAAVTACAACAAPRPMLHGLDAALPPSRAAARRVRDAAAAGDAAVCPRSAVALPTNTSYAWKADARTVDKLAWGCPVRLKSRWQSAIRNPRRWALCVTASGAVLRRRWQGEFAETASLSGAWLAI